ncbi:MAG: KOW domain-containing RNA-binding protein [Clostridia bacterium]|nr:KOW domain-containing RNA-binding protein [Clostridia bacterium]
MTDNCLGRAVTSKAGRDKGRTFLIVGIADDNHVLLADGETRKLANPKKKKLKHLRIEKDVSESICEKLTEGKKVFDAEVRKAILTFGYNSDQNQQEG